MRNARRLTLRRETLAPLSDLEMTAVNGGSHACTVGHGPSIDETCPTPTLPVAICADGLTDRGCPTISPDWCIWQTR